MANDTCYTCSCFAGFVDVLASSIFFSYCSLGGDTKRQMKRVRERSGTKSQDALAACVRTSAHQSARDVAERPDLGPWFAVISSWGA